MRRKVFDSPKRTVSLASLSVLILLLATLCTSSIIFVKASPTAITVDGDPSDWMADTSGQGENTRAYYTSYMPCGSEYVWRDEAGDDTGNGTYTYPTNTTAYPAGIVDILEFRVTSDLDNLYMLFKMGDVVNPAPSDVLGFKNIVIVVAIDTDNVYDSGEEWTATGAHVKVRGELKWEWQVVIRANATGEYEDVGADTYWYGPMLINSSWFPFRTVEVKGSTTTDYIEVRVPLKGTSPTGMFSYDMTPIMDVSWKFVVMVGFANWQVGGYLNSPYSGDMLEVSQTAGPLNPGGGDYDWADPSVFDMCFYESKAAQEADLQGWSIGEPMYVGGVSYGQGFENICFPSSTTPTPPQAKFTETPPPYFANITTINFDASSSVPGWNGTHTVPIANYTWDFGDETSTVTTTSPTVNHIYTTEGNYTASLTVTCEDDPVLIKLGLTSNSISEVITVLASPQPPVNATHPSLVFEDDFESYDAGTFPHAGGWVIWYGSPAMYVVEGVSFSPTKSLLLGGYCHATAAWSPYPHGIPDSNTKIMVYSVYVRARSVYPYETERTTAIVGFGKQGYASPRFANPVIFSSIGKIKTVGGKILQSYEDDTWYKIEVVLNTTTDTFSVWIDDELKGSGFNTTFPSSEILDFCLTAGSNGLVGYYDNVRLYCGPGPPSCPIAEFGYSPSSPRMNDAVTFDASDSLPGWNGTVFMPIISYDWNFGDGSKGTGAVATHTYTAEGKYTVTLSVTDSQGLGNTTQQTVTVSPPLPHGPTAHFTFNPSTPLENEEVGFDASVSLPGFNSSTTVPIANYTWDFGDGTPNVTTTSPTVTHTYTTEGNYTASLTVTCEDDPVLIEEGLTSKSTSEVITVLASTTVSVYPSYILGDVNDTFKVYINIEEVKGLHAWSIDMSWNSSVLECLSFTFNFSFFGPEDQVIHATGTINNTAGNIQQYAASFFHGGPKVDGSGTLAQGVFRVLTNGSTSINLMIDLLNISHDSIPCQVVNGYFAVPTPPHGPAAHFTYSPNDVFVNVSTTFDASASSPGWSGTVTIPIANYAWDFGDGTHVTTTSPTFTHTYTAVGNYTITLSVTDTQGNRNTITQTTTVNLAEFSLVTLYQVHLDLKYWSSEGAKLTAAFYTYDGIYQSNTTIQTISTPTWMELSTNIEHPQGKPIEIVKLVLTDNSGNVLHTVKSYAIRRSDLMGTLGELDHLWTVPGADRSAIMKEYVAIDGQWSYAPP